MPRTLDSSAVSASSRTSTSERHSNRSLVRSLAPIASLVHATRRLLFARCSLRTRSGRCCPAMSSCRSMKTAVLKFQPSTPLPPCRQSIVLALPTWRRRYKRSSKELWRAYDAAHAAHDGRRHDVGHGPRRANRTGADADRVVRRLGGFQEIEFDFVADNPGRTLFHCHQQLHMDFGFMALFDYA